jgi:hypothetical protein
MHTRTVGCLTNPGHLSQPQLMWWVQILPCSCCWSVRRRFAFEPYWLRGGHATSLFAGTTPNQTSGTLEVRQTQWGRWYGSHAVILSWKVHFTDSFICQFEQMQFVMLAGHSRSQRKGVTLHYVAILDDISHDNCEPSISVNQEDA